MAPVKTPTSSLSVAELVAYKIWYRGNANLKWVLRRLRTQQPPVAQSTPIARLPQDVVELIFSFLIYDIDTLLACSATCYSWYTTTLPHLYRYLTIDDEMIPEDRHEWPKPLRKPYKLGLLPFVKQLCIRNIDTFAPDRFNKCTLRYFSALTNLRELGIDHLQLSSFMPDIQRYFGHFAPTLQFLALKEPKGSSREILCFIGLFPNLRDLKLCYPYPIEEEEESTADSALIPLHKPPLCGRLILACFTREGLVKDMIALFGGLRFRYMDLFRVKCARLLLDACTETLETLRLYPTDPLGSNEVVRQHFDLSKHKSIKTLETTAKSTADAGDAFGFLKTVLSTIPSSLPLNLVVVYRGPEVGHYGWDRMTMGALPPSTKPLVVQQLLESFSMFRELYSVREFRLVLCADVLACVEKHATEILERSRVKAQRRDGGSDVLESAMVVSDRRSPHIRFRGVSAGDLSTCPIYASAL